MKPREFKDKPSLRVEYKAGQNRKAWMNRILFTNWINEVNEKMKEDNRNILMLVDNASAHNIDGLQLSNITLKFIDPNCTAALQPMDAGVIRSFKAKFYDAMYDQEEKPSLYETLCLVETAWREVHPDTLIKAFRHTGILGNKQNDPTEPCSASTSAVAELSVVSRISI